MFLSPLKAIFMQKKKRQKNSTRALAHTHTVCTAGNGDEPSCTVGPVGLGVACTHRDVYTRKIERGKNKK
jgi:hypothetical protein